MVLDDGTSAGALQGTLVGLLAAFSYELSILAAASRLTSADAFRTLHALYRERTHPLAHPGGVPSGGDSTAPADAGASSSSSNGGAPSLPILHHTYGTAHVLITTII